MNHLESPAPASPTHEEGAANGRDDGMASAREPLELANEQGQRIQELVEKLEKLPDPAARSLAQDCVQAVLTFYGTGLERILRLVEAAGARNQNGFETLTKDPVVRGLLLIHGLHPVALETRLQEALQKVRPYLGSHGGGVELLSLQNGRARLKLLGACESCASSAVTMELALRRAIEEACPDLAGLEVEGGGGTANASPAPETVAEQVEIGQALELPNGSFLALKAAAVPLLICKTNDQLYAYRDHCPACNLPLHLGEMRDATFQCSLGHRYNIQQAGRSLQGSAVHLDPFPLMVENGTVQVFVR